MHKDCLLAILLRGNDWGEGLNFLSSENDYQQVGIWRYNKGRRLKAHIHLIKPREILVTQEVIFVKNGRLKVDIYTNKEKFFETIELNTGDTIILLRGGHGYEILEDDTQVLEIKNGPYVGAEEDRKRI